MASRLCYMALLHEEPLGKSGVMCGYHMVYFLVGGKQLSIMSPCLLLT